MQLGFLSWFDLDVGDSNNHNFCVQLEDDKRSRGGYADLVCNLSC